MKTGQSLPSFGEIRGRFLQSHERPYPAGEQSVPLVLEAKEGRSPDELVGILEAHSEELRTAIYDHGAILIRGFDVRTDADFARAISSIRGVRPMEGYFMAEAGRSVVPGSTHVFHTNTFVKTGGGFQRPGDGFHSENYYTIDTPALQTFWCKKSSWWGGETALIHVARAYEGVADDLKARLEGDPVCTPEAWLVSQVAETYGVSENFIEEFFSEFGLPTVSVGDKRCIVLQKPCVYWHPRTKRVTLSANLCGELPELRPALNALFEPHYTGGKWFLHRLAWRHPRLMRVFSTLDNLPTLIKFHPKAAVRIFLDLVRSSRSLDARRRQAQEEHWRWHFKLTGTRRLANKMTSAEVKGLASALWKHCSVFRWQRGDILMWDNLQVLHSGMPGLGPRELGVMLCNPISVPYPLAAGPGQVLPDDDYDSIDARLRKARPSAQVGSAAS